MTISYVNSLESAHTAAQRDWFPRSMMYPHDLDRDWALCVCFDYRSFISLVLTVPNRKYISFSPLVVFI